MERFTDASGYLILVPFEQEKAVTKFLKFGYEGEGPLLGRKTAYASYPDVPVKVAIDAAVDKGVDSLYFLIEDDFRLFVESLLSAELRTIKAVTLDFPAEKWSFFEKFRFAFQFMRCGLSTAIDDLPKNGSLFSYTYIKMVCEREADFSLFVEKANDIANTGHKVLLMPEFLCSDPYLLGEIMMKEFDNLHNLVRLMPPVHRVLGMP